MGTVTDSEQVTFHARPLGPRGSRGVVGSADPAAELTPTAAAVLCAIPAWWVARATKVGLSGKWLDVHQALNVEPPLVLAVGVVGLLLLGHSRRLEHPFLPLPLLRFPVFAAATGLAPLLGAGIFGGVSYFPLYLQKHFGMDSLQAGRAMLPMMMGWVACSSQSARLGLRFGYAPVVGLSSLGLLFGYLSLCFGWVAPGQIGLGMAGGLSFTPLTLSVQEAVAREQLGQTTASVVFLRTLGASLGTAVLGAVLHGWGFVWMFRVGAFLAGLALLAFLPYRRALIS